MKAYEYIQPHGWKNLIKVKKVKMSRYTPWRHIGGEEV
jgi:hypothetical protein